MKSINYIFLCLLLCIFNVSYAQTKGWVENFDDGNLSRWKADHERTFQLSAENGALKINYTRTSASNMWDNFNYTPPQTLDITGSPVIMIKLKSNVNTVLSIKPTSGSDVPLIDQSIIGNGNWQTLKFNIINPGSKTFNKIYMYFDGGTTANKNGTVWFDEIRMGDSVGVSYIIDWIGLDRAISAAESLLMNSTEGNGEGQFKAGSKSLLQAIIDNTKKIKTSGTKLQSVVDKAVWDLYDACVNFEKAANTLSTNLIDQNATKETRYLYLNLLKMQRNSMLFGMHDATGYGVGWNGDNDRSDVKDVSGDFPALFSEDVNGIEQDQGVDGIRYRMTNAFNQGSVITFCWHQMDPTGTSFYAQNIRDKGYDTRVIAKYLPGGTNHKEYKDKLYKAANFFKSFRGVKGYSIPVIFRPYHEHLGDWFWWGPAHATTQEYNSIWQFTVRYLRDSLNVHNFIYAFSPSLDQFEPSNKYFSIYPGDEYVDVFGTDYYFPGSPTDFHRNLMVSGLKKIVGYAKDRSKLPALTEVGQENLPTADWFTTCLLNPIKNDSAASAVVYAAVWRNASITHHFAPFPGDATVPDFLKFYNDPFTVFQSDLPKMYEVPTEDKTAPVFISKHDTIQISIMPLTTITVETNERSFLRYSLVDESYDAMKNQFTLGEGSFKHSVQVQGKQGQIISLFVRASDMYGNKTDQSLKIQFKVDTLQTPIAWFDNRYPDNDWLNGKAVLGSDANAITKTNNVRTLYLRKLLNLDQLPLGLAVTIKSHGGAALYVNGFEVGRLNLPEQVKLDYNTNPTSTLAFTKNFVLNSSALAKLIKGQNLIAVEIHADAAGSVQMFDAQIINQSYQVVMPFGSIWNYFDKGLKPKDIKLGDITSIGLASQLPSEFKLFQNYPNPFNPSTTIRYQIPVVDALSAVSEWMPTAEVHVTLKVYDVLGREVAVLVDEFKEPGTYYYRYTTSQLNSTGSSLASGVYFYTLKANGYSKTMKMMILK